MQPLASTSFVHLALLLSLSFGRSLCSSGEKTNEGVHVVQDPVVIRQDPVVVIQDPVVVDDVDDHPEEVAEDPRCQKACTALGKSYPAIVFYGTSPEYWTPQQKEVIPECFVQPTSAEETSSILSILVQEQCQFAVRSGGHGIHRGLSNAYQGVTIDLKNINHARVSEDKSSVEIGVGLKWRDAYAKLEAQGVLVQGGRVGDIGVGGFLMGGGVSYFLGRYSWSSTSILSYEIVLPNATIAHVSPANDPDLFWALHGGTNNYGIVTSLTVQAYPSRPIWFGSLAFPWSDVAELTKVMGEFSQKLQPADPDASAIWCFGYEADSATWMAVPAVAHVNFPPTNSASSKESTDPLPTSEHPEAFSRILTSPSLHPISQTVNTFSAALSTVVSLSDLGNPPNFRTVFQTLTYRASASLDLKILNEYKRTLEKELFPIMEGAKGLLKPGISPPTKEDGGPEDFAWEPILVMQPLPLEALNKRHGSDSAASGPGAETDSDPTDEESFPFTATSTEPLTLLLTSHRYTVPPPSKTYFRSQQAFDAFQLYQIESLFERFEEIIKSHREGDDDPSAWSNSTYADYTDPNGSYSHPFIYANYAGPHQNPYSPASLSGGLGLDVGLRKLQKLAAIRARVDPGNVFGKDEAKGGLCRGGWGIEFPVSGSDGATNEDTNAYADTYADTYADAETPRDEEEAPTNEEKTRARSEEKRKEWFAEGEEGIRMSRFVRDEL